MQDAQNSTRQGDELPLDEEAREALTISLDSIIGGNVTDAGIDLLVSRGHSDVRFALGMARTLKRDLALIAEKNEQLAVFVEEVAVAKAPILRRIENAERVLADLARLRRTEGLGNAFVIPTVGTFTARRNPERWAIDNDKVIADLPEDEAKDFVFEEKRDPVKKLRGPEFRKHLDKIVQEAAAQPDVKERLAAAKSPDEIEAILNDVKHEATADYDGVEFIAAEVRVNHDIR